MALYDLIQRNLVAVMKKPDGSPWAGARVRYSISETQADPSIIVPKTTVEAFANAQGIATAALYTLEGSYLNYDATLPAGDSQTISLPDEDGDAELNILWNVAAQAEEIRIRPATESVIGGVIVGDGLEIDEDGVLSATGGGGGGAVDSVNGQTGAVVLDADDISDASTTKKFTTAAEKAKLAGIATAATANDSDANLKARANHTGQQAASTISDFSATVRSTVLTGLAAGTNTSILAADTILQALAKLQEQIENVSGGGSAESPLELEANNASEIALTLKQATSQTANIFKVTDDADAQLIAILGGVIYGNNTTARVQLESATGAWLRYSDTYIRSAAGVTLFAGAGQNAIVYANAGHETAKFDYSIAAGKTRFWIFDVDNNQLEQVEVGAADSGGAGFKVLRIPN